MLSPTILPSFCYFEATLIDLLRRFSALRAMMRRLLRLRHTIFAAAHAMLSRHAIAAAYLLFRALSFSSCHALMFERAPRYSACLLMARRAAASAYGYIRATAAASAPQDAQRQCISAAHTDCGEAI